MSVLCRSVLALTLLLVLSTALAQNPAIKTADEFTLNITAASSEDARGQLIAAYPQFATAELAKSLTADGGKQWDNGDYLKALPLLQAGAQIARAAGETRTLATALNNIGIIHGAQGHYAEALQHLQESLHLWEELKVEARVMAASMNIGSIFRWQRNFVEALAANRRVLEFSERTDNRALAGQAAVNIAFILTDMGELQAASENFRRAIDAGDAIGPRALALALSGISDVLIRQDRLAEAETFLARALELQKISEDPISATQTTGYLSWLRFRQNRLDDAIRHGKEALSMAEGNGLQETIWRAAYIIGASDLARNELEPARLAFLRSIAAIEGMRNTVIGSELEQQRFFSDKLSPYHGMLELLLKQGKTADALEYAERAKARVLLDVASSGRARIQQAMSVEERNQEGALRKSLALASAVVENLDIPGKEPTQQLLEARKERDQARMAYDRFETELHARHPELKIKRGELEWPGTDAALGLIAPDAAVLEYVVSDDRSYGILLSRNSQGGADLQSWEIPLSAAAMQKRVVELRKQLAERDYSFRKTAASLYDVLVRRAAPRLKTVKTLIIVPDGVLWELPFQALHDGSGYMLQSHTILYSPSVTVNAAIKRTPAAAPSPSRLFAVGNPASRSKPLPNAEREVKSIAALHGLQRSKVLVRTEATETIVRREMPRYDILHFATHGLREDQDPMLSRVLLTTPRSGEEQDGALEAREFMEMQLSARLVVLSACETALGTVAEGEGMIGLTWALFIAGSPITVASQWQVDSESTTDLMLGLHRDLSAAPNALDSSVAVARALRRSALHLLQSPATAHPFYWAGFVTVGTRL